MATGTYFQPDLYERPTIDGRNAALINRAGVYDGSEFHDFDHLNVRESTAHSFYQGDTYLHPWEGRTEPIDPAKGHKQGKYSWAKSPRYEVPGKGPMPMEQSLIGSPIRDAADPVEMGHVVRSYDSCLVCTVHTYDGKTGRELAKFRIGERGKP